MWSCCQADIVGYNEQMSQMNVIPKRIRTFRLRVIGGVFANSRGCLVFMTKQPTSHGNDQGKRKQSE